MTIGFIGLGTMGLPMCMNIIKRSGRQVVGFDISRQQLQLAVEAGATAAESVAEVGAKCDVVITMVPTGKDVVGVYTELLPALSAGSVVIDMSTIEPSTSVRLAEEARARDCFMLDAPVVKSKAAAEKGELGIYVGGDPQAFATVRDIIACMGNNVIFLGKNGNGLIMKICHNMLVAQIQNGVNEMLVLAQKAGIDIGSVATAISYGGGQNFYLDSKKQAIKAADFSPNFSVQNMNKDIHIAVELSKELDLVLPGAKQARTVYEEAMRQGLAGEDFSATYKVVKQLAGNRED